jgi:hypothetical protein
MENAVNQRIIMLKEHFKMLNMEFCTKVNISTGTMSNIQNDGNVSPKVIRSISESLNVNKEWLLNGKGKMLIDTSKVELSASNPWKDEAYFAVKEENNVLKKELDRMWQMVQHLTGGAKPNFLKASEYAYSTILLPSRKRFVTDSGAMVH